MKNQLALLIYLLFSLSYTVTAQDCLSKGITFTTQKQIDDFLINYPDCTNIKGNIRIEERSAKKITNLNGLSQITSIEGDLKVSDNTNLTSLKGLNNLTSIGGQLGIWGNSSLENISDLENLISINGHFTISNNISLMSLNGLNNLTFIGGFLRIKGNNSLTNLDGLDSLFSIGKDLWVASNGNLKNLNGLGNLTSINENLKVTDNKILENLNGLENLTFIGKSLKIVNNDSLKNLKILDNVTSIGGRINILNNASLTYHNELDKLSSSVGKDPQKVNENLNLNENVKINKDDRKWKFGAEVGFASVKLKRSERGKLFDNRNEEIKRTSRSGFRVAATAKYSVDDRVHFIGGFGIIKAKETASKTITDSKGGFFSPTVRTTINDDIIQDYTILEIPVYLRCYLFGKNNSISGNSNIFLDIGMSFKKPLSIESSYIRGETISTTTTGFSLFGGSSNPTTTSSSSYDNGELKLQSEISEYFAIGFLLGNRTSIAFTSTGINTQGKMTKSVKYKSRLKSISLTVFF
jgi:hypothetical protein